MISEGEEDSRAPRSTLDDSDGNEDEKKCTRRRRHAEGIEGKPRLAV